MFTTNIANLLQWVISLIDFQIIQRNIKSYKDSDKNFTIVSCKFFNKTKPTDKIEVL